MASWLLACLPVIMSLMLYSHPVLVGLSLKYINTIY